MASTSNVLAQVQPNVYILTSAAPERKQKYFFGCFQPFWLIFNIFQWFFIWNHEINAGWHEKAGSLRRYNISTSFRVQAAPKSWSNTPQHSTPTRAILCQITNLHLIFLPFQFCHSILPIICNTNYFKVEILNYAGWTSTFIFHNNKLLETSNKC